MIRTLVNIFVCLKPFFPKFTLIFNSLLFLYALSVGLSILIPYFNALLIDSLTEKDNFNHFIKFLIISLTIGFSDVAIKFLVGVCQAKHVENFGNVLRNQVIESYIMNGAKHRNIWSGDIIARITNDINGLKNFFSGFVLVGCFDIVIIILTLGLLTQYNWVFGLFTLFSLPLNLIAGHQFKNKIANSSALSKSALSTYLNYTQEWLSRLKEIVFYGIEKKATTYLEKESTILSGNVIKEKILSSKVHVIISLIQLSPTVLIFSYGGFQVYNGNLTIGSLFAIMTYFTYFNLPSTRLIGLITIDFPKIQVSYNRIEQFLTKKLSIQNDIILYPSDYLYAKNSEITLPNFKIKITDFQAAIGNITGVFGPNGSGKSLLLESIFDSATSNSQFNLNTNNQASSKVVLPIHCFLVPQKINIFEGTLTQNITLDRENSNINLNELIHDFKLNEFKTEIELKEHNLSDGYKRLVGLARGFYSNKKILLLDEPESNLDNQMLMLILKIIPKYINEKIVIISTHSSQLLTICKLKYELEYHNEYSHLVNRNGSPNS